ncbi:hypothetical protein [Marinobacter mobilis]|uniref:Nickel/cobalt transporter regulator n=1 Tax=Marinobacter mobilis TaxID=488533 RepID=A0A1H2WV00_9GAMM|nr:hypothetical protein [Marinobacter mobilis]SDW84395.1 hypothetical protein SAMN04487960_104288 [Marinobacter mobilis]
MKKALSAGMLGLLLALGSVSAVANPPGLEGLPPGLQKKVAQGEPLPPGWQRRLGIERGDHLPDYLYRDGRIYDIDDRRQRVEVEDRVYTIIRGTREILDILDHY